MSEAELVRKDINNICCIYASVGAAMFDEARERLALRISQRHEKQLAELKKQLEDNQQAARDSHAKYLDTLKACNNREDQITELREQIESMKLAWVADATIAAAAIAEKEGRRS
jgi:uncharacterized protein YfaS (alpha-2-macroglobulin family)